MTPRTQHLLSLLAELEALVLQLAEPIPPAHAAPLYDLLLRCCSYPPEEIEAAGVTERLQAVQQRLTVREADLAEAAGRGVDLGRIFQRGMALLGVDHPDPSEVEAWAVDLLRLANVAPYIPGSRGEHARDVVKRCLDLAGSAPRGFLSAATVALDRFELEAVDVLDPFSVAAHQALEILPLDAAVDASAPTLSEAKLRSLLDPIRNGTVLREGLEALPAEDEPWILALRPREQQQLGTVAPAKALPSIWDTLIRRADDALQDALDWPRELAAMLARCRQEGLVPVHADGDPGDMLRLGRHLDGDWWLLHDARGLSLQGPSGLEASVVAVVDGQDTELEVVVKGDVARWLLPAANRWLGGLTLRVQVGPDSVELRLPGAEADA
jgi:hypothetical protein